MGKLFGTDGVRGVAGRELDCELALQIGRGAAAVLTSHLDHRPKILIGKDTRISGDMLEHALAAGLCSVGADVELLGVVPTPAVACLVRQYGADAGVVISASHNPMEFNGIKIFSGNGYKLPDEAEREIEAHVLNGGRDLNLCTDSQVGRVTHRQGAVQDYVDDLTRSIRADLTGLRVAIDCANGAAVQTAQLLFPRLGADCTFLGVQPDGCNINQDCGSTHLDRLADFVVQGGYDCGIAFDGDADRCLAVDEQGKELDGDKIIALLALDRKERGCLAGDTAVATVMSNLGFLNYLEGMGVRTVCTAVGDRYVLEEMRAHGYSIGGEQSGHIILLDHSTTGDGELTAGMLLRLLAHKRCPLSRLNAVYEQYPQVMLNITVTAAQKAAYTQDEIIAGYIKRCQQELMDTGRVLVRLSGTEPLIRVMVEGRDRQTIQDYAQRIAQVIRERLG